MNNTIVEPNPRNRSDEFLDVRCDSKMLFEKTILEMEFNGEGFLASLRDAFVVWCFTRWYRPDAPQPPANRCEASGFKKQHPGRIHVGFHTERDTHRNSSQRDASH